MKSLLNRSAFTLIELLVVMVVVAILSLIGLSVHGAVMDKALCAKDASQMRNITAALLSRAGDNEGRFYTKDEIGNSSYRVYNDKYSLCQILLTYLPDKKIWTSPRPHPRTVTYGNSYAWSRSANVVDKTIVGSTSSLRNTILLWNNSTFITPSPMNNPDPGSNGGPTNASTANQFKPWQKNTAQNWCYGDGHVETF